MRELSVNIAQYMGEKSGKSKYLSIAEALRQAIKDAQVLPNELLPSARKLSQMLAVNRHTVMAAYAELVAQGWVETKQRSGYRVASTLPIHSSKLQIKAIDVEGSFQWEFAKQVSLAVPHQGRKQKKACDYLFNFSGGQPDVSAFPFHEFKSYFSQTLQRPKLNQLSYGDNQGEKVLIDQIAIYLRRVRAITDKETLICNGSQEGLYMISQLLLKAGDKVALEALGYPPARMAFNSAGAELVTIKQDEKGIVPNSLAKALAKGGIKLIYLTPLHQYPTTVTLDATRRMQIYQLAAQYSVPIIEDDYDHEFHYDSQPIAPMAADDPLGLVIYISTFSKLMFGAARVGYVVANKALIEELSRYKMLINHKSNVLIQHGVAKWMEQGGFEAHLRRMTRLYHKRRDFMVSLLKGYQQQGLPLKFTCPAGGMAIWLDTGKSVTGLKEKLFPLQVYLQTELEFSLHPNLANSHYRHIRLGFASMDENEVEQGLKIIMRTLYESV